MTSIGELVRRVWRLVRRDRYTAELEEEMRLHLDLREARLREGGATADEARAGARRRFGSTVAIEEQSRDEWGFGWVSDAMSDFRFAARRLRLRPGFSAATIIVAALGIGATTAVFSAVDAALIRPLPFVNPSQLVVLPDVLLPSDIGEPPRQTAVHFVDTHDIAAQHDIFTQVGAFAAGGLNLADAAHPRRVNVGVVTSGFFELLGIRISTGRSFGDAESHPNGPQSAILSDKLWRTQFGSIDVIGKSIELSGKQYTVVGIAPAGFEFPNESDLWIPMTVPVTFDTFAPFRGFLNSTVVARLVPGVTPAAAASHVLAMWDRGLAPGVSDRTTSVREWLTSAHNDGGVVPLRQQLVGTRGRALLILMGVTTLLLLIACSNIASMLVSDAVSRRREIALREVLGASRGRITRQLLAESLLLALAGAAAGVALSPSALHVLDSMMPPNLAGLAPPRLDLRVLTFAVGLAVMTGLVFGLWPAHSSAHADAIDTIKSGGLGTTASRLGVARRGLIVAEMTLTVMLLVASGLMLRSLSRLLGQNDGMRTDHVGTLELSFRTGEPSPERLAAVHGMLDRLNRDPSIVSAGVVNDLPLRARGGMSVTLDVDGLPAPTSVDQMRFARQLMASGGYFKTLGIPVLRGRTFTAHDDSLAPKVAIINATMAQRWWRNGDAIGHTFHMGPAEYTIVGVIADVREATLADSVIPQMYFSIEAGTPQNIALVARSQLPPNQLLARMTAAVRAVDPRQAVYNVRMMDDVVSHSVAPRSTNTLLIAIFGAIALLLSAFGVYGVVSYSAARRTREFGIRAALGATAANIVTLVGREMIGVLIAGVALGLGGAWALSRVLASLLYEVHVHDLRTFLLAPVPLVLLAIVATLVPSVRATRVSPMEVMRTE